MGLRLEIEEGGGRRAIPVAGEAISIGRGAGNTVVIQDPRSSRNHCRLVPTPQGWLLEDLESRNGTIVNGSPVKQSLLRAGSHFLVGSTRFSLHDETIAMPGARAAAPWPAPPTASSPPAADDADDDEAELELDLEEESVDEPEPPPTSRPTEVVPAVRSRSGAGAVKAAEPSAVASAAAAPKAWIEAAGADKEVVKIHFTRPVLVFGRSKSCDVVLEDKRASGQHAKISMENGAYVLEDLQSRNGTLVNGQPVQRASLAPGAVIQIGSSRFRLQVAGVTPSRGGEGGSDEVVRFDLERFLERDRSQHPAAVIALLALLCVIGYFAVDITRGLLREEVLDPLVEGNLLTHNWSFEAAPAAGGSAPPGWRVAAGDEGELTIVRDKAQHPGRQAMLLRAAAGDGLCRASPEEDVLLATDRVYRLEGFAASQGAFAAGLSIDWFRPAADGVVPMGRTYSDTARQNGEAIDVDQTVIAPANASIARVACFVLGGGGAIFDRISLRPGPAPSVATAAPAADDKGKRNGGEGQGRSWRAGTETEPLLLSLGTDGVFGVARKRRVLLSLWAGLGPDEDPSAYGPRLAALRTNAADSSTFDSEVPDQKGRAWLTIEGKAVVAQKEVVCHWRTAQEAGDAARAICLYLEPADRSLPLVPQEQAEAMPGVEAAGAIPSLLVGERDERLTLTFSPPLTRKAGTQPAGSSRPLTILEGPAGGFTVTVTAGSRREAEGAEAVLLQAEEAFRGGKSGEAIRLLESVPAKYPEEKAAQLRAQSRLAEWKQAAVDEIMALETELAFLKSTPASVVLELLLGRLKAVEARYQGTPEGERAARLAAEASSFWSRLDQARCEDELARMLVLARQAFGAGQLGLAELYFRKLLEARAPAPAQREAENTLRLIQSRHDRDKNILLQ